ncbi:MAG TPA: HWE histidine kinase domain-containing protein [Allosphingosinicella sp.]|jgi:PAS domain S-box-containing protein
MAMHTPIDPADAVESRMADEIGAFDWRATPLGPRESWPAHLRFAVSMCIHCSVPTVLYWGSERIMIHNDAWRAAMGGLTAIGLPAARAMGSLWDVVGPAVAEVEEKKEGAFFSDEPLTMQRGGLEEETYWNCSLLPVFDEDGQVAGVLNQANEVTRTVQAERRLSFQIRLADRLRGLSDPEEVKRAATQLLGEHLGAARVGYAEIDEASGTASVRSDWTRSPEVASLAGQRAVFDVFGQDALAFLRTGEVLALPDIRAFARRPEIVEAWEAVGVRALITVPLVREGELRALLYVHEPKARAWKRADAAIARDVAERTWAAVERAQAEQSLRESEDHYRHTVELDPQITWTATPDGLLNRVARRWEEWTGTSGLGSSWAEGLHPEDREPSAQAWLRSVATGEPYDIEHRVKHSDGSYRWARSRAYPRFDAEGSICFWYGSTEDIHERRVAEEHQRLLINELNHRVKNTLATVQAIAFQTMKGDIPLAEARRRFEARLLALSSAHNLLTEQNWGRAALDRVVRDATAHLAAEAGRFTVEGDPLWLAPRAALALALALHELGTNAAKYGALSTEGGCVSIRWRVEGEILRLDWKEQGGPAVAEPPRRGFGSRLIERGLEADLGGTARLSFEPDGLRCSIAASLAAVAAPEPALG